MDVYLRHFNLSSANLSGAFLNGANLSNANLSKVNLSGALLYRANLSSADLSNANLSNAKIANANLRNSFFSNVNLRGAALNVVDCRCAKFSSAKFSYASVKVVNFQSAYLDDAQFTNAVFVNCNFESCRLEQTDFARSNIGYCSFVNTNMSESKGLETVNHSAPSSIAIDTLYMSTGKIPEVFLRGCGVPEDFIVYLPSLIGAKEAVQFYSCFISYSSKDEDFAQRLYSRMQTENLRVWFAPIDMKRGEKIWSQIDTAIQAHERLLLVVSEESMKSKWVVTEIRRALKAQKSDGRKKLFPIRLVNYDKIKEWELMDTDTGEDLAVEIRSYYMPDDFTNWKDHDSFEAGFKKLLRDLKAQE